MTASPHHPDRKLAVETAKRYATYEDIVRLPEHLVGEILNGELYTHPRPAPKHTRSSSAIGGMLGNAYDWGSGGPGGWWILDEPELHLGDNILVPDLAGWRRDRLPALPETAWFELPPDWVCEVLSPATARVDRAIKMPIYAGCGIPHLWLIDPDLKTLEVYVLDHRQSLPHWLLVTTLEGEATVRQVPFEAIEFSLAKLWA